MSHDCHFFQWRKNRGHQLKVKIEREVVFKERGEGVK